MKNNDRLQRVQRSNPHFNSFYKYACHYPFFFLSPSLSLSKKTVVFCILASTYIMYTVHCPIGCQPVSKSVLSVRHVHWVMFLTIYSSTYSNYLSCFMYDQGQKLRKTTWQQTSCHMNSLRSNHTTRKLFVDWKTKYFVSGKTLIL